MLASRIRFTFGAMALALIVAVSSPVGAQQRNPDNSVNPTASSVKEEQLLQEFQRIQGRGTIPDTRSYVIEQPAGRDWRHFHEVTLRWIGAIAIIGMLAILVVFYLVRGMVRIESGRCAHDLLSQSRYGPARARSFGPNHRALYVIRALRALDDGDLLRHPRPFRAQHHLRQAAAVAPDRA
jgi:hypothetical protein